MLYIFIATCKGIFVSIKVLTGIVWTGLKAVFTSRKKIVFFAIGTALLYGIKLILSSLHIPPNNLLLSLIWGGYIIYPFIYVVLLNGGIVRRVKNYFLRKKYQQIFESVNFMSTDKFYPGYMNTIITENMKIITFYSTIPISTWLHKQDLLENGFNARFYEIKDRPANNRIIDISILTKQLPTVIPWNDSFIANGDVLNIGEGYHGRVGMNLAKQPHAFIAGETGSGKSIILQCMIYQALKKNYKIFLIDFKRGVSFSGFSGFVDMVIELEQAEKLLSDMIAEVKKRLDLFVAEGVQDIKGYNKKVAKEKRLQRVIVVVDELAELVDIGGADKEEKAIIQAISRNLRTLARIARAPCIHLILGVQRPDSNIIDGQIKSNIPFRVCGHFADPQPSIIVLGNSKAAQLPNIPGRFIADNQEIQAFYSTFQPEQLENLCPTPHVKLKPSCSSAVEKDTTPLMEQQDKPSSIDASTEKHIKSSQEQLDLDYRDL